MVIGPKVKASWASPPVSAYASGVSACASVGHQLSCLHLLVKDCVLLVRSAKEKQTFKSRGNSIKLLILFSPIHLVLGVYKGGKMIKGENFMQGSYP